ncbi:pyridoxamine 5'-phosphate oxidase family protein [Candidatus Kaiserbacteria bacterium]|nr:pyridoxamine 5'-phosphate oxidase family protein [Candidatus Kaiserbacteria bacterium]
MSGILYVFAGSSNGRTSTFGVEYRGPNPWPATNMNQEILAYLKSQRVGVFAIEMLDGSPHAATVHYANTDGPVFIFETDRVYRKSEPLLARKESRASMVVGSNEGDMKTLQLDGIASMIAEDSPLLETYFAKFPEKKAKYAPPKSLFFTFTPTWWRFTDWTKPKGKTIATSND